MNCKISFKNVAMSLKTEMASVHDRINSRWIKFFPISSTVVVVIIVSFKVSSVNLFLRNLAVKKMVQSKSVLWTQNRPFVFRDACSCEESYCLTVCDNFHFIGFQSNIAWSENKLLFKKVLSSYFLENFSEKHSFFN